MKLVCLHIKMERLKNISRAQHWWLRPIILATLKAEIRGIMFPNQSGQIA
jgi:hypothetical protein